MTENIPQQIPGPRIPDQYTETVIDLNLLTTEDRQVIDLLYAEAEQETAADKRAEAIRGIHELAGELALSEMIQRQAEEDIEIAKAYSSTTRQKNEKKEVDRKSFIDTEKIGWLLDSEPFETDIELISESGADYWFGSIINAHDSTADAFAHLEDEDVADSLMVSLKRDAIPLFLLNLRGGKGSLRPVNTSTAVNNNKRNINTTYPAYKFDVQGTNNRAIVLLPEKVEGKQVIILAAIYDHEDQDKIFKVLGI